MIHAQMDHEQIPVFVHVEALAADFVVPFYPSFLLLKGQGSFRAVIQMSELEVREECLVVWDVHWTEASMPVDPVLCHVVVLDIAQFFLSLIQRKLNAYTGLGFF